jgi:hypothetical protein
VKLVREHLKATQSRQKIYADNKRRELEFKVGDIVFLRLTPSRGSLNHPKGGKLTSIHDVFHVSQLKKYNPDPKYVLNDEPFTVVSKFELC